jgi:hypothetical protein
VYAAFPLSVQVNTLICLKYISTHEKERGRFLRCVRLHAVCFMRDAAAAIIKKQPMRKKRVHFLAFCSLSLHSFLSSLCAFFRRSRAHIYTGREREKRAPFFLRLMHHPHNKNNTYSFHPHSSSPPHVSSFVLCAKFLHKIPFPWRARTHAAGVPATPY